MEELKVKGGTIRWVSYPEMSESEFVGQRYRFDELRFPWKKLYYSGMLPDTARMVAHKYSAEVEWPQRYRPIYSKVRTASGGIWVSKPARLIIGAHWMFIHGRKSWRWRHFTEKEQDKILKWNGYR